MPQQVWSKTGGDSTAGIKSREDMGGRFPSIVFVIPLNHTQQSHLSAARGITPTRSQEEPLWGWGVGGVPQWRLVFGDVTVPVSMHHWRSSLLGVKASLWSHLGERPAWTTTRRRDALLPYVHSMHILLRVCSTPIIFLGLWEFRLFWIQQGFVFPLHHFFGIHKRLH